MEYTELKVWQKGMELVKKIYVIAKSFPKSEIFGLTNQIKRATISIPANIAEGYGRWQLNTYIYHLSVAHGSLLEVETFIHMAKELKFIDEIICSEIIQRTQELHKMLKSLIWSLKKRDPNN